MNPVAKHHRIIDSLIRNTRFSTCCTGCTRCDCCSEAAYASNYEVTYMIEALDEQAKIEVAERAKAWITKAKPLLGMNMPDAFTWRELDNPCPFLKDGRCRVYDRRPFGCRVWFAHENPDNCAMPQRKTQKYASLQIPIHVLREIFSPFQHLKSSLVLDHIGMHTYNQLVQPNEEPAFSGSAQHGNNW